MLEQSPALGIIQMVIYMYAEEIRWENPPRPTWCAMRRKHILSISKFLGILDFRHLSTIVYFF